MINAVEIAKITSTTPSEAMCAVQQAVACGSFEPCERALPARELPLVPWAAFCSVERVAGDSFRLGSTAKPGGGAR